ncbi:hypothetical protein C2E25_08205 [Geothermobacter hydrogeniphilus]|uniref:Lipoprotein n=2 Tax=Geothermobacter hydrogeniphilus TaxID=1969733 RepID=A0A2K2HAD5_9BACT|nr:hypothetical protein C2E25_08205 [Geothermobacter hydrogeniphilus]
MMKIMKSVAILLLCLVLLSACHQRPAVHTEKGFSVVPPNEKIYIVPFTTVMVPREVEEGIFDQFVDALNAEGVVDRYEFVILKQNLSTIDKDWLADHYYLTGDLFAYVEESGCCATTIRSRSRLKLFQPGQSEPTLVMEYPREIFFEHDYSNILVQRRRLATDIATTLAQKLLKSLAGS